MATKKKTIIVPEREELMTNAFNLTKQGHSTSYIKQQITLQSGNGYSDEEVDKIISEATFLLSDNYLNKIKDIKLLHIKRYVTSINRLLSTKEYPEVAEPGKKSVTYKQWVDSRNKKIKAFDNAIDTMIQLENILQISNDDLIVDINHEVDIKVKETPNSYNIHKLTFDEKVETMGYIELITVGNKEQVSVSEIPAQQKQETIDVFAEVLPANVTQIQQITPPVILQTDTAPFDPTKKLRENLQKLAAKKILEAGGNLDEREKALLIEKN